MGGRAEAGARVAAGGAVAGGHARGIVGPVEGLSDVASTVRTLTGR